MAIKLPPDLVTERYKLVVFDWDGTLMDSAGAIVSAMQAASVDLGLPPPEETLARHVIGLGLQEALAHAVPELREADYPQMVDRYRHHYFARDLSLKLFTGAEALLTSLQARGTRLAVATGKGRRGLNRSMEVSGLTLMFQATRTADDCASKPHPEMLLQIMEELDARPEETLMIGDTTHDLLMARNANVAALGISHGAHTRLALEAATPLAIVDDLSGLAAWLDERV